MKKVIFGILIGLLAGGAGVWVFLQRHGAGEKGEKAEPKKEEHKEESHVLHGTNGATQLKFDQEAQAKLGLKVAALEPAGLAHEVKAFGRVLDPAPLAAAVSDLALASAQAEGSKREYERLKVLFNQNQNASARALETAEVARQRDELALRAARVRFTGTWGPAVTQMEGLDKFIGATIAHSAAVVRVDVAAGDIPKENPAAARVALAADPEKLVDAKVLGPAVDADPQVQGRGYLLTTSAGLPANGAVVAWLSLDGEKEAGVIVPRDAIVRHEGEAFIYVQAAGDIFERKELELEHPLEKGWFTADLKPGVKVVVAGAQQLLSEELKGEGGE